MADTANLLIDTVLRRVRDPNGTAHSRDFVKDMVSRAQQFAAGAKDLVTSSITLTTTPRRQVYPIKALIPNALRITGVRHNEKEINLVDWRTLAQVDRSWFRRVGPQFRVAAVIGRDILVIHPARDVSSSVTVVYTKLTSSLVTGTEAMELDDDDNSLILDMAEVIVSVKGRNFDSLAAPLTRLQQRLGLTDAKS